MKTKLNFLLVFALLAALVGGITTAAYAQEDVTYSISGQLFYDDNQNGILDGDDYYTYFGETIQLDQGCDGTVDDSFLLTYSVQTYTFDNLPEGQSYCIRYYNPGYRTTTPNPVTTSLSEDMTGVNIGFAYVYLDYDRDVDLNGPVGVEYTRTVAVTGGDGPYDFTGTQWSSWNQPPGLNLRTNSAAGTLTISGMPTVVAEGQIHLQATDANGADLNQTLVFWIQTDASASFTSSQSPSNAGQQVTFSLEFTPIEPDAPFPFGGNVIFYDGDSAIEGCQDLLFAEGNFWGEYLDYNPVACSTSALSVGTHPITAVYLSSIGAYKSGAFSLTQEVVVAAEATTTTLASSQNPSLLGGSVSFTAPVSPAPDGAGNLHGQRAGGRHARHHRRV